MIFFDKSNLFKVLVGFGFDFSNHILDSIVLNYLQLKALLYLL